MLNFPKEAQKGGSRLRIVGDALEAGISGPTNLSLLGERHKCGSSWGPTHGLVWSKFAKDTEWFWLSQQSSAFVVFQATARICELNSKRPRTVGAQGGT